MFSLFPMQRTFLSIILLIAGLSHIVLMAQSPASESEAAKHFHAAQRYQQQGQLDAAAEEYRAAQRLQPAIPEIYVNLGLVYYAQAKFTESANALMQAQKLRPGMHGAVLWLGIDEVRLHHPQEGVALLREALHQDADDKVAQEWLGRALWNAGEWNASLHQMRAAVAKFPTDPDLLFQLGEAYGKAAKLECELLLKAAGGTALSDRIYAYLYSDEHDWSKAEGHLARALQREPTSVEAHIAMADVLLAETKLLAAEQQLDAAAKLTPKNAGILARQAELLLLEQKTLPGMKKLDTALGANQSEALNALGLPVDDEKDQPGQSTETASLCKKTVDQLSAVTITASAQHIALAALDACAGETTDAMQEFRSIPPTRAETVSTSNLRAAAFDAMYTHRYDKAEELLEQWIASHPNDKEAQFDRIIVYRHLAIVLIDRLLTIAPNSYHVHQLLGQLYIDREEDEKALDEYSALAAEHPDLPGVHFWLGHLAWKQGKADQAKLEFTRELNLDPENANAQEELGAVLITQAQIKEAISYLQAAIQNKPELWPAYLQLGKAYIEQRDYAQAEAAVRKALPHDVDGAAFYQLARILQAEGKTTEAREAFARVQAIKQEQLTPYTSVETEAQP